MPAVPPERPSIVRRNNDHHIRLLLSITSRSIMPDIPSMSAAASSIVLPPLPQTPRPLAIASHLKLPNLLADLAQV